MFGLRDCPSLDEKLLINDSLLFVDDNANAHPVRVQAFTWVCIKPGFGVPDLYLPDRTDL